MYFSELCVNKLVAVKLLKLLLLNNNCSNKKLWEMFAVRVCANITITVKLLGSNN